MASKNKKLKKADWIPQALRILKERYLRKDSQGKVDETPEEMLWRVADEMAEVEKKYGADQKKADEWKNLFYQMMADKLFLPNSPTLMNAGRGTDLQYSGCYVLPVDDSIDGIFKAVRDAAVVHQSGGGTGFSFSRLRPSGSRVKKSGGVASGPVSFMRVFDSATEQVKQGGRRRGANMGVLRVDHPDIETFIRCKLDGGITNFNISVGITEDFMQALKNEKDYSLIAQSGWPKGSNGRYKKGEKIGKKSAKKVFDQLISAAWASGDPGVVWLDRINKTSANPVPDMGPVEATNPCLIGSSLISTKQGLVPIGALVKNKEKLAVLTKGGKLIKVDNFWNRGEKEIWKLKTKSGYSLEGTADHLIYTTNRGWVELSNLNPKKDNVLIQTQGSGFSSNFNLSFKTNELNLPSQWSEDLGLVLGWLIGDGWLRDHPKESRVGFTFGEEGKQIMESIAARVSDWYGKGINPIKRDNNVYHLSYHSKKLVSFFKKLGVKPVSAEEKRVPGSLYTAPKEVIRGFLKGLFTADGTAAYQPEKSNKYIRLTSKSELLLKDVQILLLNFGILSTIYDRSRPAKKKFDYQTVEGKQKEYICDGICFELNISRVSLKRFIKEIGFWGDKHKRRLDKMLKDEFYSDKNEDLVVSVENTGLKETVYDISVPGENNFYANGILVHNCGEQPLYPNESCNLGSINLGKMVKRRGRGYNIDWDKLERIVRLSVRFLDNVIDVNPFPLPEIKESVELNRRIGLGVMGWADLLFQLRVPYDSKEGVKLGQKVMKFINDKGWDESEKLAKEKEPFPNFKKSIYKKGKPKRNATITTIAPTGSISIIAGCSSGIEPIFALAFTHTVEDRKLHFVNPFFERAMSKYKNGKQVLKEVKKKGHLGEVSSATSRMRDIFKTAHEIDYQWHVKMQAAFQKYVDNAVSKTINLPNKASKEDVKEAILLAYQEGCNGITVFRDGCKGEQVLTSGVDEGDKVEAKTEEFDVKPRPAAVKGYTYRVETPVGTAFVTVNHNGKTDYPLEVFVNVGKAGSDVAADAEAIGRLISLCLRISSPGLTPKEVTELIVDQLEGIGGGASVGFGKERVRSLADGIAKVLDKHIKEDGKGGEVKVISEQQSLKVNGGKRKDICPECGNATLVLEEGCVKCASCGYSKC